MSSMGLASQGQKRCAKGNTAEEYAPAVRFLGPLPKGAALSYESTESCVANTPYPQAQAKAKGFGHIRLL